MTGWLTLGGLGARRIRLTTSKADVEAANAALLFDVARELLELLRRYGRRPLSQPFPCLSAA